MYQLISMKATYTEDPDDMSESREDNNIEIEAVENVGEFYFVIKTDRWAIDDEEELLKLFRDFKSRLDIKQP